MSTRSSPHSRRSLVLVATSAGIGVLLSPAAAGAHTGHPAGGLGDGALHPVGGMDHLLVMVAVGIVATVLGTSRLDWRIPAAFLATMVVGGAAAMAGVPVPGVEWVIVGSVLLGGLAVAGTVDGRGRWSTAVVALLALSGLAHGAAHGAEAPVDANLAAYLVGFVGATATLHLFGAGLGAIIRDRRTVRVGFGLSTFTAGAMLLV